MTFCYLHTYVHTHMYTIISCTQKQGYTYLIRCVPVPSGQTFAKIKDIITYHNKLQGAHYTLQVYIYHDLLESIVTLSLGIIYLCIITTFIFAKNTKLKNCMIHTFLFIVSVSKCAQLQCKEKSVSSSLLSTSSILLKDEDQLLLSNDTSILLGC